MPSIDRRTFLGTLPILGLAGCSSSCPDSDSPEPTVRFGTGDPGSGFETLPGGSWPAPRFDAGNTGFAPSRRPPVDSPSLRWRTTVPTGTGRASSPAVADGRVHLVTDAGAFALDLRDGTERWRNASLSAAQMGEDERELAPPVVGDDAVFVATGDGVVALRPDDGTVDWRYAERSATGPPTVVGDGVILPTVDGPVALDAAGGSERWAATGVGADGASAPDGSSGAGTANGTGGASEPDDSSGAGAAAERDDAAGSSLLAVADGTVVAGGDELVAVDAASGDHLWTSSVRPESHPVVADGTVYVGTYEGLVGVDLDDGRERWTVDRGSGRAFSAPVVAPETVYAVERPGEAGDATFALDRVDDGAPTPRWCSYVGEGAVTAAAGGHAFALQSGASAERAPARLVAFTRRFGEAAWGFASADRALPPAILDGGAVVANRRGTVAAVGGG